MPSTSINPGVSMNATITSAIAANRATSTSAAAGSGVSAEPVAPSARPIKKAAWRRSSVNPSVMALAAPLLGLMFLVLVWQLIAMNNRQFPTPLVTLQEAIKLFSDPFYRAGPNDQGIGWNILASLQRVAIGFGLAALVGIPLGFMIGRFQFLSSMFGPIISLLKPVSPLAWLPIGLLVFKSANPAAIWSIFICSIWPM